MNLKLSISEASMAFSARKLWACSNLMLVLKKQKGRAYGKLNINPKLESQKKNPRLVVGYESGIVKRLQKFLWCDWISNLGLKQAV